MVEASYARDHVVVQVGVSLLCDAVDDSIPSLPIHNCSLLDKTRINRLHREYLVPVPRMDFWLEDLDKVTVMHLSPYQTTGGNHQVSDGSDAADITFRRHTSDSVRYNARLVVSFGAQNMYLVSALDRSAIIHRFSDAGGRYQICGR